MKEVGSYNLAYEANIVKARLEDAGIMAETFGEVSTYTCLNAVNPIKVFVNDEDYEEAVRILTDGQ